MDSQIIAMLQNRDEGALSEIRRIYGALCGKLAYRILGSQQDAEECVSDMLLAVWNSRQPVSPQELKAYLVSLTRHSAMDKLKTRTRLKRGGKQFALALDELAEILPSAEQVEQLAEQHELTAALTDWLRSQPQQIRRIFLQRYYLSASVQEIAAQNGMSVSAVKMTLLRTRKKLKAYLETEELL